MHTLCGTDQVLDCIISTQPRDQLVPALSSMALRIANKRLTKELAGKTDVIAKFFFVSQINYLDIQRSGPPAGTALLRADDLKEWFFTLSVLGESVYEKETFALRFKFSDNYPLEAPEVVFLCSEGFKPPEVRPNSIENTASVFISPCSTLTYIRTAIVVYQFFRQSGVRCSMSAAYCSLCKVCWRAARCVLLPTAWSDI